MKDLLDNLNSAQKQAVLHKNGPMLIIAGAGTGKTRVLTHRIANLVLNCDVSPEQILALTFTEKAAGEMQERLDLLLPYGYSELWAKTFHGFSDAVLREKGLELGLDTAYRILSSVDLTLFLKKHLFDFDLNHYRPLGNPLRFLSALTTHFGHLRDELISPQAYLAYADGLLESPTCVEDNEIAEKHLELAKAYLKYDEILLKEGVLDFASLQYLVVKLFEQHSSILQSYQKRFQYVLVDEYQDTNTAQNRIAELLSEKHKNLMVVGDDDQCIYKWRGASFTNILQFETRFPDAKKIVLKENYRSDQSILDLSYQVIQNNNPFRLESRETLDKKLVSQIDKTTYSRPHSLHFNHYSKEVEFVVEQIKRHVAEDKGISYKDIAVLVRATANALPFLDAFQKAEIPFYFSGAQGLYQQPEIKDLLALLKLLISPYDDVALFRVLLMPIFNFETEYLVSLLHQAKTASTPLLKLLRSKAAEQDLFSETDPNQLSLKNFLALFEELQSLIKDHSTSQILGIFLKKSAYLKLLEDKNSYEAIFNLASFSQIVRSFEEDHGSPRLNECYDYLSAREEIGDRMSSSEEAIDSNTVKILTIHAAKGLEFDTVFLVNLVQGRFPSTGRGDQIDFPEDLLADVADKDATHLHEERRLFYVAATRAKHHLFLCHSNYYDGKKRWKPSIFIDEASNFMDVTDDSEKFLIPQTQQLAATDVLGEKPLVFQYKSLQKNSPLSFSKINTFQTCPLRYKFQYIYKLAEPLSHQLSFGQSVHNTLNAFYQELKHGVQPSLDRLKELFEKYWIPLGYTSVAHLESRKKNGFFMLENFFIQNSKEWIIPEFLEKPFTLKLPSNLSIIGRIDRIDRLSDGTLEVIDYKTGKIKDQKEIDKDLQLSIYALSCQQVLKIPVSKLSLYFLEDGQKISTTRTLEQLDKTEEELISLAEAITTSSFEPLPSPYTCQYCDYRLLCNKAAI